MQHILLTQTAMGSVAGGVLGIYILLWWITIISPVVFLACWYASEFLRLVSDFIHRRNLLEESEFDRQMEGRLFDPDYKKQNNTLDAQ